MSDLTQCSTGASARSAPDLFGKPPPVTREVTHAAIVELLRLKGHPKRFFHADGALERASQRMRFARLGTPPAFRPGAGASQPGGGVCRDQGELGLLSPAKQDFQARCAVLGLRYAILRDVAEAEEKFKAWGALRPGREEA